MDFVLTFEELMGMFEAREVDFEALEAAEGDEFDKASADGRGFAVTGGVAQAVVNAIHELDPRGGKGGQRPGPGRVQKAAHDGPGRQIQRLSAGGHGLPGGCMGGAGTLADPAKAAAALTKYKAEAPMQRSTESPYEIDLGF